MKWRTNLILLLILAGLGIWYYAYDIRGEKIRKEKEIETKRLFPGIKSEDVVSFKFKRIPRDAEGNAISEKMISFKKNDTKWEIESPVSTAADTSVVQSLVDEIVMLQQNKTIPVKDDTEDVFGLKNYAFFLDFQTSGDSTKNIHHNLFVGNENPTKQFLYVRMDAPDKAWLVPDDFKEKLTKNLFYFRDKNLITLETDQINKLEYSIPNQIVAKLERDGDENWKMDLPVQAPGDRSRIDDLLFALRDAKVKRFIDSPEDDLSQYGLTTPTLTITLWSKDDTNQKILLGRFTDDSAKQIYASRSGVHSVFIVDGSLKEKFPADFFTLRDKSICSFERAEIQKIELKTPDNTITLEKTGEKWTMSAPEQIPVDDLSVGGFLSDLAYLKATGLKPESAEFGNPYLSILLFSEAADKPAVNVVVGSKPQDGVGRWVKSGNADVIFRVSDSDVSKLNKTSFDFRDKDLTNVSKADIDEIRVEHKGEKWVIRPEGTSWKLVSPEKTEIDPETLADVFWDLHHLQMNGIVSTSLENLDQYGLKSPELTVSIKTKDALTGPIRFGNITDEGDKRYVVKEGSNLIMTVAETDISGLLTLISPAQDMKKGE